MFTAVNSISAKGVNTFLDLFQNWYHFSSGAVIRVIQSLRFERKDAYWSVRIDRRWRALARVENDTAY